MNDCKLYDELPSIVRDQGPIAALACQFSGATWHPTCYEYPQGEYERISRHKLIFKFEMVARAIEVVSPRIYLPSAGPACFLDPSLIHLNFEPVNIFPRASKFLDYLRPRLAKSLTKALDIAPGDVVDVSTAEFIRRAEERFEEPCLEAYLRSYAATSSKLFADLQSPLTREAVCAVLERLQLELDRKLSAFKLHERVRVPLYFHLSDWSETMLRIDFPRKTVEVVRGIVEPDYYSISSPSFQISRILDGKITWEEFALTFRMRLKRCPDVYQTLIQGFLLLEAKDMNSFCDKMVEIEERRKRVIVDAGGTRYSINQYCPHQGADLSQGWLDHGRLWTCPRHRWQFALDKGGRCLTSDATINAVCMEGD
jgi:UDP-MurNAc hydroxylase